MILDRDKFSYVTRTHFFPSLSSVAVFRRQLTASLKSAFFHVLSFIDDRLEVGVLILEVKAWFLNPIVQAVRI